MVRYSTSSALLLPSDLVMAIAAELHCAPSFCAMHATCKSWHAALLAVGEAEVDCLWLQFAAGRFANAADILKHLGSAVPAGFGQRLYWSQLKIEQSEPKIVAPPPPIKTALSDYLFAVEVDYIQHDGTTAGGRRWSGCLDDEIHSEFSTRCELWASEGELPEWFTTWQADANSYIVDHRVATRVYVTKLATLQTIQLCNGQFNSHLWAQLPASTPMRLSTNWSLETVAQMCFGHGVGQNESFGLAFELGFDYGYIHADAEQTVPTGNDYQGSMLKEEVLRYLEHYAPWHLHD